MKPANILIDNHGHLLLADFRLADRLKLYASLRVESARGKHEHIFIQFVRSMLLQPFISSPCGIGVDFWSLGCLLYFMCTYFKISIWAGTKKRHTFQTIWYVVSYYEKKITTRIRKSRTMISLEILSRKILRISARRELGEYRMQVVIWQRIIRSRWLRCTINYNIWRRIVQSWSWNKRGSAFSTCWKTSLHTRSLGQTGYDEIDAMRNDWPSSIHLWI